MVNSRSSSGDPLAIGSHSLNDRVFSIQAMRRLSTEPIEDGLREQLARIKGWLKENAALQATATPEALPELEREQKMLERALRATRERLSDPFLDALSRRRER